MKSSFLQFLALLASACILPLTGAALHASEADDSIELAARKTYVFKTYLKDDAVTAQAKDGVVVLTGTVSEESHKTLAEGTVEALPGVTRVDNRLTIRGGGPVRETDAWLAVKVTEALLFHRDVSAVKTEVSVVVGTVRLRGEASSLAQKELTGEYAKDVEGVKEVRNEMTVAAVAPAPVQTLGEKIDDASITGQVKVALLSHYSTSALKTGVTTRDGVVTLSGAAKNAAEKSLVTKLVADIGGVAGVINNMTVEVTAASNE